MTATPRVAPYGSWKSPITAELVASKAVQLGQVRLDGDTIFWVELRPAESGRNVLVRRTPDGRIADVTPAAFNVRTLAHEYGGAAYTVDRGTVYFSSYADQRLYRQDPGAEPRLITSAGERRYADGTIDARRGRMIGVLEDHSSKGRQAVNSIVAIPLDGQGEPRVLISGNDFYSNPRISPDGGRLAWLTWNHPNMPWDGTELWLADVGPDGSVKNARRVAGGEEESIFQPDWAPNGVLHFVSDRTGWWNLYRWRDQRAEPVVQGNAEFGRPQWVFGMSTYAFESERRILCIVSERGIDRLASIDTRTLELQTIDTPYSRFGEAIQAGRGRAVFVAGSPTEFPAVIAWDLAKRRGEVLRRSIEVPVDPGYLSIPEAIEFPTEGGLSAHAFFYPPCNRDYAAPPDGLPPLLVMSHGGPTSATSTVLNLGIQYWTSRGFAVVDVNYGGSTGYGRAYRQRLNELWGVVDVDDCTNAARFLIRRGQVDAASVAIRGGSAGGYTTLCAITFRDFFRAAASHFGVSDLELLARDTHKFESRYLDRLIGPYPERRDLYRERSPINFLDRVSCPVIIFQGLEDKIVPPNQSELIVAALRKRGTPVAYVPFEGEQHGFRRAESIKRALEGELYFYSRIFGFAPADRLEPVPIENL